MPRLQHVTARHRHRPTEQATAAAEINFSAIRTRIHQGELIKLLCGSPAEGEFSGSPGKASPESPPNECRPPATPGSCVRYNACLWGTGEGK